MPPTMKITIRLKRDLSVIKCANLIHGFSFEKNFLILLPVVRKEIAKALLGDSDMVRIGEDVVAIGNPLALEQTLTRGVVSGLNRFVPDSPFSLSLPLIQTDAPINPGNSGGPLINRCGEAIGINTLMVSDAQNIGFAIPINIAKQVIPQAKIGATIEHFG